LAVDDLFYIAQIFEGYDLQSWNKGDAQAKAVTLSFWVNTTKTGTYILRLSAGARHICQAYTVSSADTWEYKTLTFPGDTTGVFANSAATALYVQWALVAGTNYTSGTLATSWAADSAANRFVGQVDAFDSTSNNFHLTGVQLELGSTATAFEYQSYGENLAECQRYLVMYNSATDGGGAYNYYAGGLCNSTTVLRPMFEFPVEMRTLPTMTTPAVAQFLTGRKASASTVVSAMSINAHSNSMRAVVEVTIGSADMTAGEFGWILSNNNNTSYVSFDAELS
jgi:hypothetical protein